MSRLVRKQLHQDSADIDAIERLVTAKGGRKKGYSFSREVSAAIRQHIRRELGEREEATMTPIWQRLLDEKFGQMETWLRSGVWAGATYSTTAALLLLEVMCGKKIDPSHAREHFELVRGRAWKIVRRDPGAGAQTPNRPGDEE